MYNNVINFLHAKSNIQARISSPKMQRANSNVLTHIVWRSTDDVWSWMVLLDSVVVMNVYSVSSGVEGNELSVNTTSQIFLIANINIWNDLKWFTHMRPYQVHVWPLCFLFGPNEGAVCNWWVSTYESITAHTKLWLAGQFIVDCTPAPACV